MVSILDSVSKVRALARDIVLCSWARYLTLTVPLSIQVYKWVPANLMPVVTLRWPSIPSRGEWKYSWSLHTTDIGDKRRLMSHLVRMQTLPLPTTKWMRTAVQRQFIKLQLTLITNHIGSLKVSTLLHKTDEKRLHTRAGPWDKSVKR